VGTSSMFYKLYFRFYCIVVLRSENLVAFQNEHPVYIECRYIVLDDTDLTLQEGNAS
jgi:hypothetical protein